MKKLKNVYGVSTDVLLDSYVDRGGIDRAFKDYLNDNIHVGVCGQSKCGKSWLRQMWLPDAIVIQCRINFTVEDIYKQALNILGVKVVSEETTSSGKKFRLQASGEAGNDLFAKIAAESEFEIERSGDCTYINIGNDFSDLRYIAEVVKQSGRRLVIEDFHYLKTKVREDFARDLKTLWDYKCYVVIIGVWVEKNMILSLNSELALRIEEVQVDWGPDDLRKIEANGSKALKIKLSREIVNRITIDSFGNSGLFQSLVAKTIKEAGYSEEQNEQVQIDNCAFYEAAALHIAEQLNGLYQDFAKRVASGIRKRKKATGIYAHLMAVVVDFKNEDLLKGIDFLIVFQMAHRRESRIQQGNLRKVLTKIDSLQVDSEGRGLVITFDGKYLLVVDRNLLFYKKYCTVQWPWEQIIKESEDDYQSELDFENEVLPCC